MKKKHLILIFIGLIGFGLSYGYYSYTKGPRDLSAEKADVSMSAQALLSAFQSDEAHANTLYLDKVVVVSGKVSAIEAGKVSSITLETEDLMSAIVCELAEASMVEGVQEGQNITIKGQCTGFLSDVILVKSIIQN